MKAIMISIKPKNIAKILNGEKTIEIRRTMPKCDLPIDVYIYCTKEKNLFYVDYEPYGGHGYVATRLDCEENNLSGTVVAKFTLNKVEEIMFNDKEVQRKACLTEDELFDYLFVRKPYHEDMKKGYAWHISNLEIFNRPKELSEFKRCTEKTCIYGKCHKYMHCLKSLTKAPQSWCYVEE